LWELTHMIMDSQKSHSIPPLNCRSRKHGAIIQPESKDLRTKRMVVLLSLQGLRNRGYWSKSLSLSLKAREARALFRAGEDRYSSSESRDRIDHSYSFSY
jgi:hypothetical protein